MGSEPHEGVHWIMFCGKKIPFKPRQYAAVPSSNPSARHTTHTTRDTRDTHHTTQGTSVSLRLGSRNRGEAADAPVVMLRCTISGTSEGSSG
jgi:hypothetical protein